MTFGIYRGIMPHNFESTNNNGVTQMKDKKKLDGCGQFGWTIFGWSKIVVLVFSLLCLLGNTGCGGTGDDDNCEVVDNCPDGPDAGPMADADPDAPDADDTMTPDANPEDACAAFDQPSPTGIGVWWDCTGGTNTQCENPRFIVDSGECYSACNDGSTAGRVTSSDQTSTWHYFTTMTTAITTCRPL